MGGGRERWQRGGVRVIGLGFSMEEMAHAFNQCINAMAAVTPSFTQRGGDAGIDRGGETIEDDENEFSHDPYVVHGRGVEIRPQPVTLPVCVYVCM